MMGNKKNKINKRSNCHRHIYLKKKARRHKERGDRARDTHSNREKQDTDIREKVAIEGSRIINLVKLQQYTDNLILIVKVPSS